MKKAWNYVVTMWQPAGAYAICSILVAALLVFHLGRLLPAAPVEVASRSSVQSINIIRDNPINAPYKIVRLLTHKANNKLAAERAVSAVVAGISVLLFYRLARRFWGKQAALLSAALYASSSILLNNGRLATPNIMLLLLLALFASGYALRFSNHCKRTWVIATAVTAIALYTPGMLYFVIAGIVLQLWRSKNSRKLPDNIVLGSCTLLAMVLLTPLALGLIASPHLWSEFLGIPAVLPTAVGFLKNVAAVPLSLFIRAPFNPIYRLGRQPVLNVFEAVLLVLGCYAMVRNYRLNRLYLFTGIFILAILTTALSGNFENSFMLLPFVYLVVGAGLGYLLDVWKAVFPLNPLARSVSLGVLSIAVLVSCNFQAWRYYVAWPHNQEVKAAFVSRQ